MLNLKDISIGNVFCIDDVRRSPKLRVFNGFVDILTRKHEILETIQNCELREMGVNEVCPLLELKVKELNKIKEQIIESVTQEIKQDDTDINSRKGRYKTS